VSGLIRVIVLILFAAVGAHAQGLNSGSNGTDGALTLVTPGEVIFDPVAMGLDSDRDSVFHFTTITIGAGVTVRMRFNTLQGLPVVWLASGSVQIDGTVDLDGQAGAATSPGLLNRGAVPGPGGYPGGVGWGGPGFSGVDFRAGLGPGGGPTHYIGTQAGHAGAGASVPSSAGGASYGNAVLVPLRGGSGGGGGGDNGNNIAPVPGASGGAGGGALRIFSSTSIAIGGTLTANGGSGGADPQWGGGGGSGGSLHLIAPSIMGSGVLSASGGAHGSPVWSIAPASTGRIRLDAFTQLFTGSADPLANLGTPYNVPLPAGLPAVRVTSIAGIPVAAAPTGEAATPDATINQSGSVTVAIEAKNIPLGTVVQVRVMSEAVADFVVECTPLAGTLQLSTATADVTFPPGFSRGLIRATWTPPTP
jgi:hypothetical protein